MKMALHLRIAKDVLDKYRPLRWVIIMIPNGVKAVVMISKRYLVMNGLSLNIKDIYSWDLIQGLLFGWPWDLKIWIG